MTLEANLIVLAELGGALSRCVESAVGSDGLPHSLFKVALPW